VREDAEAPHVGGSAAPPTGPSDRGTPTASFSNAAPIDSGRSFVPSTCDDHQDGPSTITTTHRHVAPLVPPSPNEPQTTTSAAPSVDAPPLADARPPTPQSPAYLMSQNSGRLTRTPTDVFADAARLEEGDGGRARAGG